MQRTMAFLDLIRVESGRMELAINVACENAVAVQGALSPFPQQVETAMRSCLSVELKAVPVEAPRPCRVVDEGSRTSDLLEIDLFFRQGGVCIPEAVVTTEIWQTRINADTCACGDDDHVCLGDKFGGVEDRV